MRTFNHQPASDSGPDTHTYPDTLEQIYAQYVDPIYRYLYARVGNREDAEDLTSQVFLKAFRQLDVARTERSVVSWLYTVARTVLADHWRQEYRHGPLSEIDDNVIDRSDTLGASGDEEKVQRVDELLALLPARSRAVLELRFLHGYTIDETAHALGITPGNVKVIQRRALLRAADLVEDREGHGSPTVGSQAIA